MKNITIKFATFLALMMVCVASVQQADAQTSRIYLAGYMGLNTMPDNDIKETTSNTSGTYKTNHAMSFSGAIGLRLNRQIRFEGEMSYRKSDFSEIVTDTAIYQTGGEISNMSWFLNGFYDFDQFKWKAKPYLSAGLGLMRFKGSVEPSGGALQSSDDTAYALGWQLGGGLKYRLNPGLALTGGYRYLSASDFGIGVYDADYNAHEFNVGIEYDLHWKK